MEILHFATEVPKTRYNSYYEKNCQQTDDVDFEVGDIPRVLILRFQGNNEELVKSSVTNTSMEECVVEAANPVPAELETPKDSKQNGEVVDMTILLPKTKREQNEDKLNCKSKKVKVKKNKTKKPKKWQKISNSSVGFNLTLFPRPSQSCESTGDIDNLLHDIEVELNKFEQQTSNFQTILLYESDKHACKNIRARKHMKVQKATKQVKSKYCLSVRNNKGRKKLYVKYRVLAAIKLECHRSHLHLPSPKQKEIVEESKPKTKPANGQNQNHPAPVQNLAHALDTSNNPASFEADVLSLLINLQHRDLTPEDYEILSILDQSVAPKTVSNRTLNSFKMEDVTEAMLGLVCSVCMEAYRKGQKVKYLPCGHDFHNACIDMWLRNSSMNCPLDGLPVDNL